MIYARSPGIMLVVIAAALLFLFLLHRTLDRLRMGKFEALLLIAAMLLGGLLPAIPLGGGLAANIGGMIIPAAICFYLIARASSREEKVRGLITAVLVAAVVWTIDRLLPVTPGSLGYELDPMYLPAVAAGLIACVAGRSRRSAFIGAVLGVVLLDLSAWAENLIRGFRDIPVILGGAGVYDATLVAGVFGVMLAELVGEIRERAGSR
ncbi:MAG TPA: DUF1614 domain-containing protein [Bacillota bacterium]|jgi:hypothetical protein|nr:DUF1614 domain-containing protein [Bacillota bacterium]HOB87375.1 DUF1614 domain-containing protein [Bacillota bacterium]HOP69477.1 DUF1614 domain-containing protein [Bacillota bacterium]HPT34403.1 DUF1614 domain-containing protein [Bacillota bacterium]HQD06239.1 DUF1614 domain-containing protein [Bacillota bacterium]